VILTEREKLKPSGKTTGHMRAMVGESLSGTQCLPKSLSGTDLEKN
jgi:hypothetical protein